MIIVRIELEGPGTPGPRPKKIQIRTKANA